MWAVQAHISVRISGAFTDAEAASGKGAGSTLATTASFKSGRAAFDGMRALAMPGAGIQPWLTAVRKPKNRTAPTTRSRTIFAPGFSRCPVGGVEILSLNIWLFPPPTTYLRSEEHTSELQSPDHLVCRLLLEKKKTYLHYLVIHINSTFL